MPVASLTVAADVVPSPHVQVALWEPPSRSVKVAVPVTAAFTLSGSTELLHVIGPTDGGRLAWTVTMTIPVVHWGSATPLVSPLSQIV